MSRAYVLNRITIFLILTFVIAVPNGPAINEMSNYPSVQSTNSDIGDLLIEDIIGSPVDAKEEYVGPLKSICDDAHWIKRWITKNHDLIEIEYDPTCLEVISFILPMSWYKIPIETQSRSSESIYESARIYLETLAQRGLFSFPKDAIFKTVQHDSIGWVVEWTHVIDGVIVKDDFCSVILNSDGSHIFSLTKQWHEIEISVNPNISKDDAIGIVKSYVDANLEEMNPSTSLEIVSMSGNEYLAWVVTIDMHEYWIDAQTSELIRICNTLTITGNKDVFVYDTENPTSYNTADEVYDRIKTAQSFSNGGSAHYYEAKSLQFITSALSLEEAICSIGHGYGIEVGGKWYTGIATTTDLLTSSYLPSDLSTIKLAFLCNCYSYADQYWLGGDTYVPVEKNICQGFLDKGAKCVFGWKKSINVDQAQVFTLYFSDRMANGYNFQSCYEYAYSRVNADTKARAKIGGDTYLHLEKDDLPGNTINQALYLGSGPGSNPLVGKWYTHLEEGLWGAIGDFCTDVDYYSIYLTEQYTTVEIWVNPLASYGRLDSVIEVYNSAHTRIIYRDLTGVNSGESCWWEGGSGWYYIKISSASVNNHGGSYDLSMHIFMIS